jgi:zinc transport system permease protein
MIGDGLSHVGFGSLTVAVALSAVTADALPGFLPAGMRTWIAGVCAGISSEPMVFTLVVVVVCATLLLRLSRGSALQGDSAIALISTSALALGVIVANSVDGLNIDVENYMFGSILTMTASDVYFSIALSVVVLAAFAALYPRIFAVTFDENFARATGMNAGLYNLLIAVLTAMTIVLGMRMMGTMLISSLIIFPALTAMRVFSRFRAVLICAAAVSVTCFVLGVLLSCISPVPVGAGIVAVNLTAFLIFSLIGAMRG